MTTRPFVTTSNKALQRLKEARTGVMAARQMKGNEMKEGHTETHTDIHTKARRQARDRETQPL